MESMMGRTLALTRTTCRLSQLYVVYPFLQWKRLFLFRDMGVMWS